MEFSREQSVVPAGVEGQLVVSDHVGSALSGRQMVEDHHGHRVEPEALRSFQPAMASDDLAVGGGEHRICPAEFDDAGGDLGDLLLVMGSRIARVGAKPIDWPVLDRVRQAGRHGVLGVSGSRHGPVTAGGIRHGARKRSSSEGGGVRAGNRMVVAGNSSFRGDTSDLSR